jgi:feruloyl esterase
MVYSDPNWDLKSFDLDRDLKAAWEKTGQPLDAANADLRPFKARGGKLILYHGWNDPAISSLNTIEYYEAMRKATGSKLADASVRLFMIPGMQHCDGGPGATSIDQYGLPAKGLPDDAVHDVHLAIEQWVEKGRAPAPLIAAKYSQENGTQHPVMTRPLCAYPEIAKYKGSGDSSDAVNFTCAAPAK